MKNKHQLLLLLWLVRKGREGDKRRRTSTNPVREDPRKFVVISNSEKKKNKKSMKRKRENKDKESKQG